MKTVGLRKLVPRVEHKGIILLLCLVLTLTSCIRAPEPVEVDVAREEHAKKTIDELKPATYIQFTKPFTLEDCIRMGLDNNLDIRIQEFNRQVADKETLAQKLKMLPKLKVGGQYEYRDKLKKSDVYDWDTDEDRRDTTVSELKEGMKADLTLTFNVLDILLAYARSESREMEEQILDRRMKRQKQQLALDITEAYWKAAAMEDAIEYVHKVEHQMKDIKKKIDSEVIARRLDKMEAADMELRMKELELTVRQLQASLSSARLDLSQLMGFNQNVQYTLARPPIKPIVAALPHTKELDIDALEEYALLHRPELFETDINVLLKKSERQTAFLTMFPGLNLFAATHYDDNRLLLSSTWNSVGAGIGWDLLALPSRWATVKGHDAAIKMAETQRLMMTVGVITQVHIALLDYSIKVDRFRLLEETYKLAEELLGMAQEKNKANRLRALAVTERHLEEMAAKLRREEAVVDMLVSHKRLCVSIGIDPLECGGDILQVGSGDGYEFTPGKAEAQKKWRCTECGYVHTGDKPPEQCPICGVGADKFEEIPFVEETARRGLNDDDLGEGWTGKSRDYVPKGARSRGAATPGWAGDASDRFLWKVQIGAFRKHGGPDKRIDQISGLDLRLMDNRDTRVETTRVHSALFNRVRIIGLTEKEAKDLVADLRGHGMEYWLLPPGTAHW